jgi:signal transduction histidine kinase
MASVRNQWMVSGAVCALVVALFMYDLHTPLGVANHVLYSGAVLVALASPVPSFPTTVAAVCSVLTVVGAYLSPELPGLPPAIPISNRLFGIVVIWLPLLFSYQRRRAEAALQKANEMLEQRVSERTRQLAQVNRALVEEVTERMQTEEAFRRAEEQRRSLTAQLMTAQDVERRRISRELHDDINQRLALLAIDLGNLEQRAVMTPELTRPAIHSAVERLAAISDDVRRMAYHFHPSVVDDLGLPAALRHLLEDFTARTGIKTVFSSQDSAEPIPQAVASCLYRIAQESLVNVAKHASASRAEVELTHDESDISLSVRDTGAGFDLARAREARGGLGLISMEERVRLLGGCLDIDSRPGQGTHIQVRIPFSGAGHEKAASALG